MGKKPVVVVVGLIWAGMVLVGCENCKNCRKKYDPAPTFGGKAAAPIIGAERTPPPPVPSTTGVSGAATKPETAKAVDPLGTQGFEKPAVGTPVSTGSPPSGTQSSLSPKTDGRPVALPGQAADYRSGEIPISRSAPSDGGYRLPLRPVSQVGASVPSGLTESLPPISDQSALPPSPLQPGALPQPPIPSTPLPQPPIPSGPVNVPGIDSIPK